MRHPVLGAISVAAFAIEYVQGVTSAMNGYSLVADPERSSQEIRGDRTHTTMALSVLFTLFLVGCGPKNVIPDENKITHNNGINNNNGILFTIIDSDRPGTLLIESEDSPNSYSKEIDLTQGRNSRMISMPAGTYFWETFCVDGQCFKRTMFGNRLMFRIENQTINYVGSMSITIDDKVCYMSVWDDSAEARLLLAKYPQLKDSYPFARNVATDRPLGGRLQLDRW